MNPSAHRALRILLYVISALEGIVGVILLFGTGWVLSFAPGILALPSTPFVLALLKGIGIIVIAFGYLFCVTARDPVRYVAVIDTMIYLLLAAGALNIYAVTCLHLGALYPDPYLLTRAAVQLALAIVFLALRPKGVRNTTT